MHLKTRRLNWNPSHPIPSHHNPKLDEKAQPEYDAFSKNFNHDFSSPETPTLVPQGPHPSKK